VTHRRSHLPLLAAMVLLALAAFTGAAAAAEIRGTVAKVDSDGELRIALPSDAMVRPGDTVKIEMAVPGVGKVEIKRRWRVKLIGQGFVIAEPQR
jgi:plastocyanin